MPNKLPTYSLTPARAIALAGIITTTFGSSALAQSSEDYFHGIKAGAQIGWEQRKIDETILPGSLNVRLNDKETDFSYGFFAGYDHQFEKFVIGGEVDINPDGATLNAPVTTGGSIELDSKWSASATARVGYLVTPQLLAYGRVGYSMNRYRIRGFAAGDNTPIASENETADGVVFGGGAEYAFNRHLSVRAEYRRNELDGSLSSNQVLSGLTYRF